MSHTITVRLTDELAAWLAETVPPDWRAGRTHRAGAIGEGKGRNQQPSAVRFWNFYSDIGGEAPPLIPENSRRGGRRRIAPPRQIPRLNRATRETRSRPTRSDVMGLETLET